MHRNQYSVKWIVFNSFQLFNIVCGTVPLHGGIAVYSWTKSNYISDEIVQRLTFGFLISYILGVREGVGVEF